MSLEARVRTRRALAGGCVGEVERWTLDDGRTVVAKLDRTGSGGLAIEARMLRHLGEKSELPVPEVLEVDAGKLVMSDLGGSPGARGRAEDEAARALAALHGITSAAHGLDFDTLIGGLPQRNDLDRDWARFYADRRLGDMAEQAAAAGRLPAEVRARVDRLRERMASELPAGATAALLHGDVWSGNVLGDGEELRGFVDPAIYFGDPEVELAFIRLFGCFSSRFFAVYDALRPPAPGDRERRFRVLQVYPLLVHVRLFGGSYVDQLDRLLRTLLR